MGLVSGVGNIGHTYIPALLMDSGLPVQIASTVVALSVVVEAPLIFSRTVLWIIGPCVS